MYIYPIMNFTLYIFVLVSYLYIRQINMDGVDYVEKKEKTGERNECIGYLITCSNQNFVKIGIK